MARRRLDPQDGAYDDINIAQGLLRESSTPSRGSSFLGTSPFRPVDDSDDHKRNGPNDGGPLRQIPRASLRSSTTWTSSSGGFPSDDEIDNRAEFLQDYNRLAEKHGVRTLGSEDSWAFNFDSSTLTADKTGSWFSRKILRKSSSTMNSQTIKLKSEKWIVPKRSISDLSMRRKLKLRKDTLKDMDLQDLVRLCGLSLLYLPAEYATGSLSIPTCFRATAQYLVQYGSSARGVFRIPGSQSVVNALYNHYCNMGHDGAMVAGTVAYPNLPEHIKCDVHDVASTFKRFLSGLPGGILGSLQLFDTFVSIQSQLSGDPELTRTKQSKVRARLIALAIATLKSHYRRELICAVLGLLCMIGRAAETTRRESGTGRPLPTFNLMGYGSLGVIFGPLLIGDTLDLYNIHLGSPQRGLTVVPIGSPRSRKERNRKSRSSGDGTVSLQTHVDKVTVANSVMEMLITHWRDVVRHLRELGALTSVNGHRSLAVRGPQQRPPMLRPSASESFMLRKPQDWEIENTATRAPARDSSPTPKSRLGVSKRSAVNSHDSGDSLRVKKQRSRPKPLSSHKLSGTRSLSILSPTVEESPGKEDVQDKATSLREVNSAKPVRTILIKSDSPTTQTSTPSRPYSGKTYQRNDSPTVPYMLPISVSKRLREGNNLSIVPSGSTILADELSHPNKAYPEAASGHSLEPLRGAVNKSNKMVRALPEPVHQDHCRQAQHITPSTPSQKCPGGLPNVMVTKASTSSLEARNMKGIVSSQVRRLVDSEPGQASMPSLFIPNRRLNSKTQDSSYQNTSKDPLARVSHDDDIASLAELAEALESLDEAVDVEMGENWEITTPTRSESKKLFIGNRKTADTHRPSKAKGRLGKSEEQPEYTAKSYQKGDEIASCRKSEASSSKIPSLSPTRSSRTDDILDTNTDKKPQAERRSRGKRSVPLVSTNDKERTDVAVADSATSSIPRPGGGKLVGTMSRGSSVKALAAKFDTADAKAVSPTRLSQIGTPKQNLLASYTRNTPTPSKSQNSMRSSKSTRSLNTPRKATNIQRTHIVPSKDSPTKCSPPKVCPPRRLIRTSLEDNTPLRPIITTEHNLGEITSKSSLELTLSRPEAFKASPPLQTPTRIPVTFDGAICSVDVGRPFTWAGEPQKQNAEASDVSANLNSLAAGDNSQGNNIAHPLEVRHTPEEFLELVPSSLDDNPDASDSSSTQCTTILQQRLSRRTEDLVNLTQQLDDRINPALADLEQLKLQLANKADSTVDILTEKLAQANREINFWKSRAELAEGRLEELVKAPLIRHPRYDTQSSSSTPSEITGQFIAQGSQDSCYACSKLLLSSTSEEPQPYSERISENSSAVTDGNGKDYHGLDGSTSQLPESGSDNTSCPTLRPHALQVSCGTFALDNEDVVQIVPVKHISGGDPSIALCPYTLQLACGSIKYNDDDGLPKPSDVLDCSTLEAGVSSGNEDGVVVVPEVAIVPPKLNPRGKEFSTSTDDTSLKAPSDIMMKKVAVARQQRIEGSESWTQTVKSSDDPFELE